MTLLRIMSCAIIVALSLSPALAKQRAASQTANTTSPRIIQANAGKPVGVGEWVACNRSCGQGPVPWINVIDRPQNGAIATELGPVKLRELASGSTKCSGMTTHGLHVLYTTNPGFHGRDHVPYRVDFASGGNADYAVDINVR
jgi:hypothetical protein